MAEDRQMYITGKDPLVAIIISPDLQEEEAEVLDGEIAHLDADHAHHLEESEKETGIEIEVGTVTETGIGTKTEILIGKERRTEVEGVIGTLRKDMTGFQCQRRRL